MQRVRPAPDHLLRLRGPGHRSRLRADPAPLRSSAMPPPHSGRPEPTSAFGGLAHPLGRRARVPRRRCGSRRCRPRPAARPACPIRACRARRASDDRVRLLLGQRLEHRVADAALRPVVLDGDDRPGLASGRADRLRVDRLDAVQVDDPRADPFAGQRSAAALIASWSVIPAPMMVTASSSVRRTTRPPPMWNVLARRIEDRRLLARRAHEDDPLAVGHLRHQRRGLVRVARIQDGRAVDRAKAAPGPRAPSATARPRRC